MTRKRKRSPKIKVSVTKMMRARFRIAMGLMKKAWANYLSSETLMMTN